jgi:hypothetical protein
MKVNNVLHIRKEGYNRLKEFNLRKGNLMQRPGEETKTHILSKSKSERAYSTGAGPMYWNIHKGLCPVQPTKERYKDFNHKG